MIAVRVRDHRSVDGLPGVDEEIAGAAVETVRGEFEEVAQRSKVEGRRMTVQLCFLLLCHSDTALRLRDDINSLSS